VCPQEKLAGVSAAASGQIAELQEALHSIMGDMETKARQLQALEQSHDMLEQAERRAGSTLQDTEAKLEAVIERNAFLEFENNNLEGELQHLREELRGVWPAPGCRVAND
jgi:chromosome segregation ATPase